MVSSRLTAHECLRTLRLHLTRHKQLIPSLLIRQFPHSSASNRILHAKDHASIGLALAELDEQGQLTGTSKTLNICGEIRRMGESDDSINRLSRELGLSKGV